MKEAEYEPPAVMASNPRLQGFRYPLLMSGLESSRTHKNYYLCVVTVKKTG
jgi:hypothetical protein